MLIPYATKLPSEIFFSNTNNLTLYEIINDSRNGEIS